MKKIVVSIVVVMLFALAFTAPWLWIDGGEDVIESFYRKHRSDLQNFKKIKNTCDCDGSCLDVQWVPFGVKVDNCSEDYYFISFLGQRFYRAGE
ncbi:MAG: hypothetical protein KBD73_02755 [Candidatus Magasanikbacteria bacterium]|nr:hypothetical protein [Candidatus Magasanikbacteria bacterium]